MPELGLTSAEASLRLISDGPNTVAADGRRATLAILVAQFSSPLVLLLLGASAVAFAVGERVEVAVIIFMVLLSAAVGFVQEERSEAAVHALQQRVALATNTLRDAVWTRVPISDVVRGDVIEVSAGEVVPADVDAEEEPELQAARTEAAKIRDANPNIVVHRVVGIANLQRRIARPNAVRRQRAVSSTIGPPPRSAKCHCYCASMPLGTAALSSGLCSPSAGGNLRDRFVAILGAVVRILGCHREFGQLAQCVFTMAQQIAGRDDALERQPLAGTVRRQQYPDPAAVAIVVVADACHSPILRPLVSR
jgi:hypothetical protein